MDVLVWFLLSIAIGQSVVLWRLFGHIIQIRRGDQHRDYAISALGQSVLTLTERVSTVERKHIIIHDN